MARPTEAAPSRGRKPLAAMPHVILGRDLHPAGRALLDARPDITVEVLPESTTEALIDRVPAADAVVLFLERMDDRALARGNRLRVVSRFGVGYDSIDIPACTRRGIPVAVTNGANDIAVAEHALMLMLGVAKHVVQYDRDVHQGVWRALNSHPMLELHGKSVLVVGFGRIGARVARLCAAFGMRVMVFDPGFPTPRIAADGHVPVRNWRDALPQADFVTLHCPLHDGNRGMMDRAAFAAMKKGAVFINTARGPLVDEAALGEALASGHLGGAGIDVLVVEPAAGDHPLFRQPNLIVSPHNAAAPDTCLARMAQRAAQNVLDGLDGTIDPGFLVNPEVLA